MLCLAMLHSKTISCGDCGFLCCFSVNLSTVAQNTVFRSSHWNTNLAGDFNVQIKIKDLQSGGQNDNKEREIFNNVGN